MNIKILSYNIHKGFDWKNKKYFLKEMREFISTSKADVVCLQEVVGQNEKYKDRGLVDSQFEYLAGELWPHFSYGHNAVYDHGHHGNLILSKFPIKNFENIDLSTNRYEKRGLLICKIELPEEEENSYFYVACSHLNLLHKGRMLQYQKIKSHIASIEDTKTPFVLAGDFNDWNKKCAHVFEDELQMSDVYKSVHGTFARTFPAAFPLVCLDRIYVKHFNIISARVMEPTPEHSVLEHLSDHLALFCEVELYGS